MFYKMIIDTGKLCNFIRDMVIILIYAEIYAQCSSAIFITGRGVPFFQKEMMKKLILLFLNFVCHYRLYSDSGIKVPLLGFQSTP